MVRHFYFECFLLKWLSLEVLETPPVMHLIPKFCLKNVEVSGTKIGNWRFTQCCQVAIKTKKTVVLIVICTIWSKINKPHYVATLLTLRGWLRHYSWPSDSSCLFLCRLLQYAQTPDLYFFNLDMFKWESLNLGLKLVCPVSGKDKRRQKSGIGSTAGVQETRSTTFF